MFYGPSLLVCSFLTTSIHQLTSSFTLCTISVASPQKWLWHSLPACRLSLDRIRFVSLSLSTFSYAHSSVCPFHLELDYWTMLELCGFLSLWLYKVARLQGNTQSRHFMWNSLLAYTGVYEGRYMEQQPRRIVGQRCHTKTKSTSSQWGGLQWIATHLS